jgi:hypothetical protein
MPVSKKRSNIGRKAIESIADVWQFIATRPWPAAWKDIASKIDKRTRFESPVILLFIICFWSKLPHISSIKRNAIIPRSIISAMVHVPVVVETNGTNNFMSMIGLMPG